MDQILSIAGSWETGLFGSSTVAIFFAIFLVAFLLVNFAAVFAGVSTLVERKVAAHMQHRIGPYRVGPHGALQWLADALKLVVKEDVIPTSTDRLLFQLAPYVVMASAFVVWVALPFAPGWSPAGFNIGILYIVALSSAGVLGIMMAGWSSGSKWALFGAMRSAAQIVSYEVPVGLTLLGMLLLSGTLDMQGIVQGQASGVPFNLVAVGGADPYSGYEGIYSWYIFRHPPFTIIAFLVFYTAVLAETNRTPFDIPEAESELVAGYHTEYSGMRFSFFFLAEYANMFTVSAVAAALFLGGWLPPFPNHAGAGLSFAGGVAAGLIGYRWKRHPMGFLGGFVIGSGLGLTAGLLLPERAPWLGMESPVLQFLEGLFWFFSKIFFLVFVMMWLRWTLPRYRVDQLMELCWKKLTPLSFLNLLAIGSLEVAVPYLRRLWH